MWSAITGFFVGTMTNLLNLFYSLTESMGFPSYGLAIILFTTALRLLLFPLNLKQGKSMKAMSLLQPQMQRLQQQYKNNPQLLNREMQALYQKYNANPMAGCLPLLVQMPVLLAMFSALRNFQYTGPGEAFFWLDSMSLPDTTLVMPIIVALSSFLQAKVMTASQPAQSGDQAKMMSMMSLYIMPLMMGWMARSFAAGLSVYWTTFNVLGFLMQILINKLVNRSHEEMKTAVAEAEAKEKVASAAREQERQKEKAAAQRKAAERKRIQEKHARSRAGEDNRGKALDFDDYM